MLKEAIQDFCKCSEILKAVINPSLSDCLDKAADLCILAGRVLPSFLCRLLWLLLTSTACWKAKGSTRSWLQPTKPLRRSHERPWTGSWGTPKPWGVSACLPRPVKDWRELCTSELFFESDLSCSLTRSDNSCSKHTWQLPSFQTRQPRALGMKACRRGTGWYQIWSREPEESLLLSVPVCDADFYPPRDRRELISIASPDKWIKWPHKTKVDKCIKTILLEHFISQAAELKPAQSEMTAHPLEQSPVQSSLKRASKSALTPCLTFPTH